MKRILLGLALVCSLAVCPPSGDAQGHAVSPLLIHAPRLRDFLGKTAAAPLRRVAPRAISREPLTSGRITSSDQLRVDPSYLGVGSAMTSTADEPMTTIDADTSTIQGSVLHPAVSYLALGPLGFYYEESVAQLGSAYFWLTYLGSYYPSEDAAHAALAAIESSWAAAGISTAACTVPSGLPASTECQEATFTPQNPPIQDQSGNIYRVKTRVMRVSNALLEDAYVLPASSFSAQQPMADSALEKVGQGIAQLFPSGPSPTATLLPTTVVSPTVMPPTATATPVPIRFSVRAHWEKLHAQPRPNGPVLRSSKIGKKVQGSLYILPATFLDRIPATIHFDVTLHGKIVASRNNNRALILASGSAPYADSMSYTPRKVGRYVLAVRVKIGGTLETSTAVLKVTK